MAAIIVVVFAVVVAAPATTSGAGSATGPRLDVGEVRDGRRKRRHGLRSLRALADSPRRRGWALLRQRVRRDGRAGRPGARSKPKSTRSSEAARRRRPRRQRQRPAAARQLVGRTKAEAAPRAASASFSRAAPSAAHRRLLLGSLRQGELAGKAGTTAFPRRRFCCSRAVLSRWSLVASPGPLRSRAAKPERARQRQASTRGVSRTVHEQQNPHCDALCQALGRTGAEEGGRGRHHWGSSDALRAAVSLVVATLKPERGSPDGEAAARRMLAAPRAAGALRSFGGVPGCHQVRAVP